MSDQPRFLQNEKPALSISPATREHTTEPLQLGPRVRELRTARNLTLEEASKRSGLARSTLSKIENEQISPTFSAITKLLKGLDIDIAQLFTTPKKSHSKGGRRDITRAEQGKTYETPTYKHELLATQLSNKKMTPYRTRVRARSFTEFSDWVRHEGEELLHVISGSVIFYTEFYEPVRLNAGDTAYYDCAMGHAMVSVSEEDALVLWVTA